MNLNVVLCQNPGYKVLSEHKLLQTLKSKGTKVSIKELNEYYKTKELHEMYTPVVDALGDEEFLVSHNRIMNDFTLKYCNTVHSAQEGKFVIADLFSRHEGITKEWLYTAITRAADLNDIFFIV